MMRIILLLLVTLTGPFCTFTQASTLVTPTTLELTSRSAIEHANTPAVTEKSLPESSTPPSHAETTEKIVPTTEEAPVNSTEPQMVESNPPTETAISTEATESTKVGTEGTKGTDTTAEASTVILEEETAKQSESMPVEIENDNDDEAMGTGQVVGIVIGALIGVIVVIAIIILVVRRMGQYSPAKKRKPQKQESILISPLKRKARQEEKKKKSGKF